MTRHTREKCGPNWPISKSSKLRTFLRFRTFFEIYTSLRWASVHLLGLYFLDASRVLIHHLLLLCLMVVCLCGLLLLLEGNGAEGQGDPVIVVWSGVLLILPVERHCLDKMINNRGRGREGEGQWEGQAETQWDGMRGGKTISTLLIPCCQLYRAGPLRTTRLRGSRTTSECQHKQTEEEANWKRKKERKKERNVPILSLPSGSCF